MAPKHENASIRGGDQAVVRLGNVSNGQVQVSAALSSQSIAAMYVAWRCAIRMICVAEDAYPRSIC